MKKTLIGTALALLTAAFTFSSCSNDEAGNAEKKVPAENLVVEGKRSTPESGNQSDTLNTNNAATGKGKAETKEKEEKEEKD